MRQKGFATIFGLCMILAIALCVKSIQEAEMNHARETTNFQTELELQSAADGGIYEQGTPQKIFDAPQREKTVAFIHKIKYFSFEIQERGFDLMALQGGIQNFGEKYGLDQKRTYRLQICCEELIYELLAHCYPTGNDVDLKLSVSHAESDGSTQIDLSSGGAACDPFNQAEDGLGVTILKNMARQIDCRREGERSRKRKAQNAKCQLLHGFPFNFIQVSAGAQPSSPTSRCHGAARAR